MKKSDNKAGSTGKKKVVIAVVAVIVAIVALVASVNFFAIKNTPAEPGPQTEMVVNHIDSAYQEWVEYVGLLDRENMHIKSYEEDGEDIIEIYALEDNENGFAELSDIVARHNQFVQENPDYFPENISIMLGHDQMLPGVCLYDYAFKTTLRDSHVPASAPNQSSLPWSCKQCRKNPLK